MFGTLMTMRPKPGQEDAVIAHMNRWSAERAPRIAGPVSAVTYRMDNGALKSAVVFEDHDTYFANANDPEQDRWYRELVEMLESEPAFEDGEVIASWNATSIPPAAAPAD